ncbi:GNAT family N-acetyltransferase [Glycomyces tritici]|uniref:GNAT family N-acetyltransferase n=1 Tax=Glycomyces tritici TaxID=2665176 RepID=A0ABT7YVR4_9ACTN|nr:GNAT family N-acetyltransferase [Glycomyces tritici]MDN3242731.1 GNAT family N-acetyltransferase [Glycomyces tritici]
MPALILPTARVGHSYLAGVREFLAEGRGGPDDRSLFGNLIREAGHPDDTPAWLERALDFERRLTTHPPAHFVPSTTYWWTEDDTYLGRINLRAHLNEQLREIGGHIGYDVRPTARRQGHATAMLAAVLPHAAALGIDKALITCDAENTASRKVIEANGGVLEDERGGKLRFRVPTAP